MQTGKHLNRLLNVNNFSNQQHVIWSTQSKKAAVKREKRTFNLSGVRIKTIIHLTKVLFLFEENIGKIRKKWPKNVHQML